MASNEHSPTTNQQATGSGDPVSAGGRKPRSPIERLVVWGLIAIGVLLIATEGVPRLRYSLDFNALNDAVISQDSADRGVTDSEAKNLVTRYSTHETRNNLPSNELASPRVDTYTYRGLISERAIYVYFGHTRKDEEPEVLAVRSEPVEFVHATVPEDNLQPQSLDTTPPQTSAE